MLHLSYSTTFLAIVLILSSLTRAASSPPPTGPDSIWANGTIAVMQQWASNIYSETNTLYQQQQSFKNPINCYIPLPPWKSFQNEERCPRAGEVTSKAVTQVGLAWKALAEAMFPDFYNLPDNSNQPRASKADFARYYIELNLQAAQLMNATEYYICRYNFTAPSAIADAVNVSYSSQGTTSPKDYWNVVLSGPSDPSQHLYAFNGTFQEYNGYWDDPFFVSYSASMSNVDDAFFYTSYLLQAPGDIAPQQTCRERLANGIPTPVAKRT